MGSIIKSVSLSFDEDSFLKDYELSPTHLLREKIWEMKGAIKKLIQNKVERLVNIIEEQARRIETLEARNEILEKETA